MERLGSRYAKRLGPSEAVLELLVGKPAAATIVRRKHCIRAPAPREHFDQQQDTVDGREVLVIAPREHAGCVIEDVQAMLDRDAVRLLGEHGGALDVVGAPPVAAELPGGDEVLERARIAAAQSGPPPSVRNENTFCSPPCGR